MTDKVQLFYSPLGMYSLLRDDYIISVLKKDGTLDLNRLESVVKYTANMGANAMRDFFWIDSQMAWETIAPFKPDNGGGIVFNDTFFAQQKMIAETCLKFGIRYYFCLFDHCGTKGDVGSFNPWRFFDDFFYGDDAADARRRYIARLLTEMAGVDFGLDLCNEPKHGVGHFLAEVFLFLEVKQFDFTKVILGSDYYLKEKVPAHGNDYRTFRDLIAAKLGVDWKLNIKTRCISPVHNATMERIEKLWGDDVKPGGQRRILYSIDGVRPRPDARQLYKIAHQVLETKRIARNKNKILFEVVLGKQENDPLDSLSGVARAYKEIFGKNPVNFGKFPDIEFPPPVNDDPGTEPGPEPPTPKPPPYPPLQEQIDELKAQIETNTKEIEALKLKLQDG